MHDAGRRTLEHLQNARELRKPEHRAGHQNKSLELLRSCFKDCSSRRGQKHARFFTCVPGKPKTSEWQMVYLKWWIKCIVVLCGSNLCRDSCTFWTCTWSVTSSSAAWLKSMCRNVESILQKIPRWWSCCGWEHRGRGLNAIWYLLVVICCLLLNGVWILRHFRSGHVYPLLWNDGCAGAALQKGWKTSCWGTASGEGNQGGHLGRWVSTSGFDENSWDSSTAVYLGP